MAERKINAHNQTQTHTKKTQRIIGHNTTTWWQRFCYLGRAPRARWWPPARARRRVCCPLRPSAGRDAIREWQQYHHGCDCAHLHEELRLDAPGGLALALRARRAERVDLVDEDDGRLRLARHLEHLLHQLLRLALPLAHQVGGRHREESRVRLGRHGLRQERLTGTRRPIQQDT